MTINEASNLFERLITATSKKSEIKIYESYLQILSHLRGRNFAESEIQSIEQELQELQLNSNPANRKKYFNKTLTKFKTFLKEKFSLVSKTHYSNLGLGLGTSFGLLAGTIFLPDAERSMGLSMGMVIGMFIGYTIGRNMDAQAKAEERVW